MFPDGLAYVRNEDWKNVPVPVPGDKVLLKFFQGVPPGYPCMFRVRILSPMYQNQAEGIAEEVYMGHEWKPGETGTIGTSDLNDWKKIPFAIHREHIFPFVPGPKQILGNF